MWVVLCTAAMAGELYINDTRVDPASVTGVVLEKVTVTFDADGNTRIVAPGYQIKVVDRPGGGRTKVAPPKPAVPAATYWLVTEDRNSEGHSVDVIINGRKALTLQSGGEQAIHDLAKFLKRGANTIVMSSNSIDPAGGSFYVFVGTGTDDAGTVRLDDPTVQYGLGPANQGAYERTYPLEVP